MGQVLTGLYSRQFLLVPRSGSHSLVAAWLQEHEPENYTDWQSSLHLHPARFLTLQSTVDQISYGAELCVVVRDPIQRFRSMIAHRELEIEQQLISPVYGPLPSLSYTRYFRFENQLQECAEWLGITIPLPHLDATEPLNKPTLTPEQEARVREIYAYDIALWESL
jgi:hypothetical protein